MIEIYWQLDEEDGIEPLDPIGEITIANGRTRITEKLTYLDSWFDALITGIEALKKSQKVAVEIVEEPEGIIFEPASKGWRLSYGKEWIEFSSIDEFINAVKSAAAEFLLKVELIPGSEDNALLKNIHKFVHHLASVV
jgi:hypothetical protein